uniref:Chitin deacetylase-like 5, isoform H n=1 Tax=Drosophila melanogaster TaxID=7227 RepID=M9NE36_DROME|nr:chitin deacetylase-like 5, isoform H [Drosophila melanogaster]AFH03484.1 chitin deacetylase-like 5, isoform H [Drosophila melanogaster]|eukprot:NP_001245807.1 chitin deacetylase-like 5, isoform H [Drosophila melanogaster]
MKYSTSRINILCLLGLCLLLFKTAPTEAQNKRTSRVTSSRSFGTNIKTDTSNGPSFDCPEEFGYYPHPSDCTQYYVCVFGGALLESCTGGLMYSHDLQTCDWPRNVGCELADTSSERNLAQSQVQRQREPHAQHVPSRVRFGAAFSSQGGTQKTATVPPQYHRSPPQVIQAQVQNIPPPPPELRVSPNPVITSRGQPKPLIDSQEDIAKLYADAQESLPPVEEEESDRQQRVYRGQPSTVSQVQRDRDGIIHQASINSIPQTGKIGSYAFGTAYRVESPSPSSLGTPQPANIFVQPTSAAPPQQSEPNRNYYNASTFNHGGSYQPQQQNQQQQPQPTPFQQAQPQEQHQQQAQAPTHSYDTSYYSVYDDDIDLYRDIEYHQQQSQEQQKTPTPQYQSAVRQQQAHPTYRPLELPATPKPPSYENQPAYNTDYDEDINSQIEQDNAYDHPTRTPQRNNNRNRGSAMYSNQDRDVISTPNRGTHPPRTRPTLKPSGTIVSKAQEFVDIYRYPPSRPDPIYPQPMPDKTAAKCRKDVCLLPDCYCGGRDIPGELPVESIPQIVLLTFDDSVNDLNKQLYTDLFEKGRVNPNGCPITATFYVSHEWTDYSQVQNLYADGHEMASHTVSHSFGEQFSQKKWTREIAGQREILAAYGGVKMSDVRGMRAPFLSVGGNKMYKMLYDSNFTYDSSMPVYENRPPSWPYTLDYKIFHDCMIPPCPTRSYPGVWQVPMVMWQDLNGGRCSMGDACSNPSDADGVTKMIMKNFERHYTTNRAPFGLFYHAAWFTQPHHKEGFIKFLDAINAMQDVWIITNWQALQWVRDPTPISRINSFQPFQCDYSDRPKRCNNPKVCNLWHKSGVRYMKTCQPCPDIYPWTGKSGIRSSRIDNEVEEPAA